MRGDGDEFDGDCHRNRYVRRRCNGDTFGRSADDRDGGKLERLGTFHERWRHGDCGVLQRRINSSWERKRAVGRRQRREWGGTIAEHGLQRNVAERNHGIAVLDVPDRGRQRRADGVYHLECGPGWEWHVRRPAVLRTGVPETYLQSG